MKTTNIIIRFFSLIMCLMIVASIGIIAVSATNQDTPFYYTLNGGDNFKTDHRQKDNDSSCYMKCTSAVGTYNAKVFGGQYYSGSIDASGGYAFHFEQGYARFMYNYVHEWGLPLAAIYAITPNNGTVASGVWSPDSVYEAGVLPASDFIH